MICSTSTRLCSEVKFFCFVAIFRVRQYGLWCWLRFSLRHWWVSPRMSRSEEVVNQAQTRRLSPTITKGQQSLLFVYTSKGISQDSQIKLFSFTWHLLQNNPTTTEPIFKDSFIFNGTGLPTSKQYQSFPIILTSLDLVASLPTV